MLLRGLFDVFAWTLYQGTQVCFIGGSQPFYWCTLWAIFCLSSTIDCNNEDSS